MKKSTWTVNFLEKPGIQLAKLFIHKFVMDIDAGEVIGAFVMVRVTCAQLRGLCMRQNVWHAMGPLVKLSQHIWEKGSSGRH